MTLTFSEFPFPFSDAQATEAGGGTDKSVCYAIWPATHNDRGVKVRISTRELSDVDGEKFGVDGKKIRDALLRNRDRLQARARDKFVAGTEVVTIDVGDLTSA